MSSFGGLGLSDEDCAEDNMGLDGRTRLGFVCHCVSLGCGTIVDLITT